MYNTNQIKKGVIMYQSQIQSGNDSMDFSYLYSTKDRDVLENYFKLKDKYDHSLTESDYLSLEKSVKEAFGQYDVVIHPETTGKHLNRLAKALGQNVVCVTKNDKETIKNLLLEQKMMKAERQSLIQCIDEMNDSFQINKIKGNQRKRFRNILFKKVELSSYDGLKVLLLDDSVFSGETLLSLKLSLDIPCDVKVLYSKY